MNNVLIVFDILDEFEDVPANMNSLEVHLLFFIKFYLTRKSILVTDVHRT